MMRKIIGEAQSHPTWLLFILFCLLWWFAGFVQSEFISTDALFDQYLEEQRAEKYAEYKDLSKEFEEDIEDFEEGEGDWQGYLFDFGVLLVIHLAKTGIISAFLFVGMSLSAVESISFGQVFKSVVVARFVFLLPLLIKVCWFSFFDLEYSYQDVRDFRPFALAGWIDTDEQWLMLPLQILDLFEILFVYVVLVGISLISKTRMNLIVRPIITTYLVMFSLSIALRIYLIGLL